MSVLIGEEAEADRKFWTQDFFGEEEGDQEFVDHEKLEDDVGSDFDVRTDDEDEAPGEGDDEDDGKRKRKKKAYQDPKKAKRKLPPPPLPSQTDKPEVKRKKARVDSPSRSSAPTPQPSLSSSSSSTPLSLRRSTKEMTARSEESRAQEERRRQQLPSRVAKTEEREMTQEELLEEAKETEVKNLQSLQQILLWEEEKKIKMRQKLSVSCGPRITFLSTRHGDTVTFPADFTYPWLS